MIAATGPRADPFLASALLGNASAAIEAARTLPPELGRDRAGLIREGGRRAVHRLHHRLFRVSGDVVDPRHECTQVEHQEEDEEEDGQEGEGEDDGEGGEAEEEGDDRPGVEGPGESGHAYG